MANKYGELTATATIHVARMKKGHSLDLMSGERSGNTTVPNRSTAIRIRFWDDTIMETLLKKGQAYTRPDQADHRLETSNWGASWTGAKVTRILDTANQIRPCLQWNNWLVFLSSAFYNDHNNERICGEWNDNEKTVGNGSSDFPRCGIGLSEAARRLAGSVCRWVHA